MINITSGLAPIRPAPGRIFRVHRNPASCCAKARDSDPELVREWARSAFEAEVHPSKSSASINLGKASMLIALEEEAAIEALHATNPPLMEQIVQRHVRQKGTASQREWEKGSGISEAPILWDLGSPSTWSLARLDGIAADVRAAFQRSCGLDSAEPLAPGGEEEQKLQQQQQQQQQQRIESGKTASAAPSAEQFPMLAISAVNEVIFEQHGYQRMQRHGDPRDLKLPQVIERGYGSSPALSIMYMEVCQRLGMPMKAALLEGRHCLLWPSRVPLRAGEEDVVVDAYCNGEIYLLKEVQQLFGLGLGSLPAATPRQLLAALLGGLRDVHWAKAVGCQPEPGLLTPISVETAMSGHVPPLKGFQIQRAVAAAERSHFLHPSDRISKLELAVLLFYAGRYQEALGLVEDDSGPDLAAFTQKLRFLQSSL